MAVWMVRAGEEGEAEATALEQSVITIGWNELPDLSTVPSRESLDALYRQIHPQASNAHIGNQVGQVWAFYSHIQVGDLAILPLKTGRRAIAIGRVTGPYR